MRQQLEVAQRVDVVLETRPVDEGAAEDPLTLESRSPHDRVRRPQIESQRIVKVLCDLEGRIGESLLVVVAPSGVAGHADFHPTDAPSGLLEPPDSYAALPQQQRCVFGCEHVEVVPVAVLAEGRCDVPPVGREETDPGRLQTIRVFGEQVQASVEQGPLVGDAALRPVSTHSAGLGFVVCLDDVAFERGQVPNDTPVLVLDRSAASIREPDIVDPILALVSPEPEPEFVILESGESHRHRDAVVPGPSEVDDDLDAWSRGLAGPGRVERIRLAAPARYGQDQHEQAQRSESGSGHASRPPDFRKSAAGNCSADDTIMLRSLDRGY